MEFSGRLVSFPIAELLQWAHNDRRTGSLVIRRSSREKRIYFEEGRIVACLTDQPAEFYGQHLLHSGFVDEATLLQCLAKCRKQEKRLGAVLEEQGLMKLTEVEKSLRRHIEDVICDIFLWQHGVFVFQAEPPPREEILAEPINTVGIAFEGARWTDEYRRIREVLEHDEVVLRRIDRGTAGDAVPADVAKAGPRAQRIFLEVDGHRTLDDIYSRVHGSYFRFLDAAFEMHNVGVLEVGNVGRESGIMSVELSLQDVIFEQAASEHMQTARRRTTSPLAAFEQLVPIWVRQPAKKEWQRMPEPVRQFYLKLDGQKRLTEILSKDEEEWGQEAELLMVQIAKEAIALLPSPLGELEAEMKKKRKSKDSLWWKELFALLPR